ncbi:MAG: hypothetical protein AB1726_03655 [Planctomycetota bacterium]
MLRIASLLAAGGLALAACATVPAAPPVVVVRDAPPRAWTAEERDRQVVDFRYSPLTWDTAICHPDDAQKTLVSERGELLLDYPGPYSRFRTRIGVAAGDREVAAQSLLEPAVPVVTTRWAGENASPLTTVAFAVPPGVELSGAAGAAAPFFRAVGPQRAERGWGKADPPYRDIVVGWNEAIAYSFPAPAGETLLWLGFIESHHREPGRRILEVWIEGEPRERIDPVAEAGCDHPVEIRLPVADRDGDGAIRVEMRCAADSPDQNAILAWLRLEEEAAAGASPRPIAELDCGAGRPYAGPPRADVLRATGTGDEPLRFVVDSADPLRPAEDRRAVLLDGQAFLAFTSPWTEAVQEGERWTFTFAPEARAVAVVAATGFSLGSVDLRWVTRQERAARAYWTDLELPYEAIRVPDPELQGLLTGAIRNIWQAREIADGRPAFQVGPTCYRGLWVVDGTFLLEAVTFLGRGAEARAGIDYLLSFQGEDGSFELLDSYWKENGIVLYLLYRHALLTGDLAWLRERWSVVERVVGAIQRLRERSREDPAAPEAGLLPAGFPDGGVGGVVAEYTNVYWCLAGLRAAARAAELLGEEDEAREWRAELADLLAVFRTASAATRIDRGDGTYALPILMAPSPEVAPVRGQWAFCHAVYPGQVFAPADPLVRGNLALLDENEREGLVLGTGWLADGIWNYFASFWAHAHLWAGHGEKAADALYAFANHASPLGAWREEQMPRGEGEQLVGDMPHNWASAELVRLVRDLVVLEREDELHLLAGLPRAWLEPGAITSFQGVVTDFGPLDLVLHVEPDRREATLLFALPSERAPARIVVHLGAWAAEASPPAALPDGWYEVAVRLAD